MIAALQVLLPYSLYIQKDAPLPALSTKVDKYDVIFPPPYQASTNWDEVSLNSDVPLVEVTHRLGPKVPQEISKCVRIFGKETIECNAVQVTFGAEDFDRSAREQNPPEMDPPLEVLFSTLNLFLQGLRKVTEAFFVRSLEPHSCVWRLGYYNNDGSELPPEKGKVRARLGTTFRFQVCGLDDRTWNNLTQLPPNYQSPAWEALSYQAFNMLPDLGPAIVLTYSSIEVLLEELTNALAKESFKPYGIWEWLNNRESYWREPSVADRADKLLSELSGRSLKEQPDLWQDFRRIRECRNNFIHEGKLEIGGRLLTTAEVAQLVLSGKKILDWLKALLTEGAKSLTFDTTTQIEIMKMFT